MRLYQCDLPNCARIVAADIGHTVFIQVPTNDGHVEDIEIHVCDQCGGVLNLDTPEPFLSQSLLDVLQAKIDAKEAAYD